MRCRMARCEISERYEPADHRRWSGSFGGLGGFGSYLGRKWRSGAPGREAQGSLAELSARHCSATARANDRVVQAHLAAPDPKCAISRCRRVARRVPWPSAMHDPATSGEVIIGVDVGASQIAGGLVTLDGDVLTHVQQRTRGGAGGDPVTRLLDVVAAVHAGGAPAGTHRSGRRRRPAWHRRRRPREHGQHPELRSRAGRGGHRPADRRADGADHVGGQRRQCAGPRGAALGGRTGTRHLVAPADCHRHRGGRRVDRERRGGPRA